MKTLITEAMPGIIKIVNKRSVKVIRDSVVIVYRYNSSAHLWCIIDWMREEYGLELYWIHAVPDLKRRKIKF